MIPTSEDARKAGERAGSSFWLFALGVWLVLLAVAVTLVLALLIWTLIGAF